MNTCGSDKTGETANAAGGCTPAAMSEPGADIAGPYGTRSFCLGNRQYMLQVNEWNSTAKQTLHAGGDNYYFKVTEQQAAVANNGGPSGFPSMFIGENGGRKTLGSGLPREVKSIQSIPTTWNWKDNGATDSATNVYNATYDVWFSTNPGGDPESYTPTGGFLMVWLHKPTDAQPIGGSPKASGVTIAGVDGTWDVWIGPNGSVQCISYVRTDVDPAYSMSFDLNLFIRDAVMNHPETLKDTMYLTNVFTGFEIWSGGIGLETSSFCVGVN
jgi:hypothetical protein